MGSATKNVLPWPSLLSTQIRPPCARRFLFVTDRPGSPLVDQLISLAATKQNDVASEDRRDAGQTSDSMLGCYPVE
jgi:hypothetical protein